MNQAQDGSPKGSGVIDGRTNWGEDDNIENLLDEHFEKFNISKREIWRNFQVYSRRVFLKKFLAHYDFYKQVMGLPGDIVELGVYRGASLLSWANFLEIRNMGDRHKKVIGFDNHQGFGKLDDKDGGENQQFVYVVSGGRCSASSRV